MTCKWCPSRLACEEHGCQISAPSAEIIAKRTKQERIRRLRTRLDRIQPTNALVDVIKGLLDLLEDEL